MSKKNAHRIGTQRPRTELIPLERLLTRHHELCGLLAQAKGQWQQYADLIAEAEQKPEIERDYVTIGNLRVNQQSTQKLIDQAISDLAALDKQLEPHLEAAQEQGT